VFVLRDGVKLFEQRVVDALIVIQVLRQFARCSQMRLCANTHSWVRVGSLIYLCDNAHTMLLLIVTSIYHA